MGKRTQCANGNMNMSDGKIFTAIGLMSGTSLDGIDAALIKTNGVDVVEFGPSLTIAYDEAFATELRKCLGTTKRGGDVERTLTQLHVVAVQAVLDKANVSASDIDLIGFHGHTVHHNPKAGLTVQFGDGALLAEKSGIAVVCDLRSQDVLAGGEGAPLVPIFHAALVHSQSKIAPPTAVLNIGGVANVTWIGKGADDILAFDTGPGNAPLNDWVLRHTGQAMDRDGNIAASGAVNLDVLKILMDKVYFDQKPPKSLDRQDFQGSKCEGLSLQDGAATLTAFIAHGVAKAQTYFPTPASTWIVTGGGRLNPQLMRNLQDLLDGDVRSADDFGWDGDAMEAQAFAYLAVRSKRGLPITFPTTTGVKEPLSGGTLHLPKT
jgi:anhydro-N-acetylmuramic acid kinase